MKEKKQLAQSANAIFSEVFPEEEKSFQSKGIRVFHSDHFLSGSVSTHSLERRAFLILFVDKGGLLSRPPLFPNFII
ncbi:hypothetical protein PDUR_11625 [Paenibacillus durus]|uniref:Uncharacterized protein n=1 Tax=Paenibacillus durus TaxID=44251 RepID=A0A089HN23_PAEDU|nr:hypothetical protein PDUR_11625 [Paenibacillus durus]